VRGEDLNRVEREIEGNGKIRGEAKRELRGESLGK